MQIQHFIQSRGRCLLLMQQQMQRKGEGSVFLFGWFVSFFFFSHKKGKNRSFPWCTYTSVFTASNKLSIPSPQYLPLPPHGCRAGHFIHQLFIQTVNDFKETVSAKNRIKSENLNGMFLELTNS